MREEKPMHRALLTPGREDLSPWPPIGQLAFDRITAMDEPTLDRAFRERHGLEEIFKPHKVGMPYQGEGRRATRRLEIKRAALARLEGISGGDGSVLWEWFDNANPESEIHPKETLQKTLKRVLTDETWKRIREVWKHTAREAAILRPSGRIAELQAMIQREFEERGLEQLTISDIIKMRNIPSTDMSRGNVGFDIKKVLTMYLLLLRGASREECAERFGTTVDNIMQQRDRFFTPKARQLIRQGRGWKQYPKPGT